MIESIDDLRRFQREDAREHGLRRVGPLDLLTRPTLRWQRLLRWTEYADNCWSGPLRPLALVLRLYWLRRSVRLGFDIPLNVFDAGLCIPHWGTIVVSAKASIGESCRLHASTNIGESEGLAPTIGRYCTIAPGAKIFGGIVIGDQVGIGANAVVNRDVPTATTVVGVPARPVSEPGTRPSRPMR
jgi:serine O-acetyltransferase